MSEVGSEGVSEVGCLDVFFLQGSVLSSYFFVVALVVVVVRLLVERSRGNRSERRTMSDTEKETGSISES